MTKTSLGVLVGILLSCLCFSACAQNSTKKPILKNIGIQLIKQDSIITSTLGADIADILFSPDKVTVYTLEPKSQVEENDFETEPHFIRKSLVGTLDKNYVGIITYILISDKQSYSTDSTLAQTFYLPVIELEFRKKKKAASITISPNDRTWTVIENGKRVLNCNYRNQELINRFTEDILSIKPTKKDQKKK